MADRASELGDLYQDALLQDVLPFWERHSIDDKCVGFFTCLDRAGNVFDTDKFVWLQARQVWMFATMYNGFEQRDRWLQIARHGTSETGGVWDYGTVYSYDSDTGELTDIEFTYDRIGRKKTVDDVVGTRTFSPEDALHGGL